MFRKPKKIQSHVRVTRLFLLLVILIAPLASCGPQTSNNFFNTAEAATRYAYVPILRQDGVVNVVDTEIMEVVASIPVSYPTGVSFNSDGSKVYVTQRLPDQGDVAVIDATKNEVEFTYTVTDVGDDPSSLLYHAQTNSLFVTHSGGVTKLPLDTFGYPTGERENIPVEYNTGEIIADGYYVFTSGSRTQEGVVVGYGVSMFNAGASGFDAIINEISLNNGGSIGMSLDTNLKELYVTNRSANTVSVLGYAGSLTQKETISIQNGSGPFGVLYLPYTASFQSLYVANTGATSQEAWFDDATDLNITEIERTNNNKQTAYTLGAADLSEYTYAIQPIALNAVSETNTLYVLKYMTGALGQGTYLSKIQYDVLGLNLDTEVQVIVAENNKPDFAGQFIGPLCENCAGPSLIQYTPPRQSSVGPLALIGLLLLAITFVLVRNRELKKTHHP